MLAAPEFLKNGSAESSFAPLLVDGNASPGCGYKKKGLGSLLPSFKKDYLG